MDMKFVGMRTKEGWRGSLPFYRVKCECGEVYEDYLHGFEGEQFTTCPHCNASNYIRNDDRFCGALMVFGFIIFILAWMLLLVSTTV